MVTRAAKRGRGERGATLFVVVLAITLLTGVGLYSLHSSALVARASGNQREARQTEYLAELGTLVMLSDMSQDPASFVGLAMAAQDQCRANQGYVTTNSAPPSCYQKESSKYVLPTPESLFETDTFGPTTDIAGSFYTELTDVAPAAWQVTGQQASSDGLQFYQGKLTTTAQLQRSLAGGPPTACTLNLMPIAGQHMTRAHVVMGPLQLQ
jgi:hypothetical protein